MNTSKPCCQADFSQTVGFQFCDRGIFRIIQHLKRNFCTFCRFSMWILYGHSDLFCQCISFQLVEHSHHTIFADHFSLRDHGIKNSWMDHHGPWGSVGKPSLIQDLLRLTGSQKIPASIAPDFHPGMIVITMRPLWCIYLTGRYTNTSQCINGKYRFLSASSVSSAVYGKCRQGTVICTMIGSLLCTPVVHLQGSFPEAHSLSSLSDLPAEKCTAGCDLLLIYSMKQHIIQKDFLR